MGNRDVMQENGIVRLMFIDALASIDFRATIADIDSE